MKIQAKIWVVMPCSVGVGYQRFWGPYCLHLQGEDGGSLDLWNIGILPQHYTMSQPRGPWLVFTKKLKANWSLITKNVKIKMCKIVGLCPIELISYWSSSISCFVLDAHEPRATCVAVITRRKLYIACFLDVSLYHQAFFTERKFCMFVFPAKDIVIHTSFSNFWSMTLTLWWHNLKIQHL
jgi:hypothetical protein